MVAYNFLQQHCKIFIILLMDINVLKVWIPQGCGAPHSTCDQDGSFRNNPRYFQLKAKSHCEYAKGVYDDHGMCVLNILSLYISSSTLRYQLA
ncbi:hypothetical protein DPMN_053643 [Dreissena polymorpha]|uniref:Uncharacterized protein n=1 Tax=Dreissena polymorpha TaxID=45954 RepID=A0A9D4CP13_DREPO|nr:hypothetical protein DPMN_053643 [Dreissena polymorpha]